MIIRGGTLVTATGRRTADLAVEDGRIARIEDHISSGGEREIDARGLLVLPGGVDPHVHLTSPATDSQDRWVDDFESGSRAALAGGITCFGNMTFCRDGESLTEAMARDQAEADAQSLIDYFLHPVLDEPTAGRLDELRALADRGHRSVKFFMTFPSFDQQADGYVAAARLAGQLGSVTLIHCEDYSLIAASTLALHRRGQNDLRHFAESRPLSAEVVAVKRAVTLCETADAPVYIVHLSSQRALEVCSEARMRGLPLYVETRPLYLHHTAARFAEPDGPIFIGAPPLRSPEDQTALWSGLEDGRIDVVASDHAPWTRAQKLDPRQTAIGARQGVADLDTMLPLLFSEGVVKGRITLERFVALTAERPARLFGLYPQKGSFAVGADADLAVWDPNHRHTITGASIQSRAAHSVYEGMTVTGKPRFVLRRGEILVDDFVVRGAPGSGRLAVRQPFAQM